MYSSSMAFITLKPSSTRCLILGRAEPSMPHDCCSICMCNAFENLDGETTYSVEAELDEQPESVETHAKHDLG